MGQREAGAGEQDKSVFVGKSQREGQRAGRLLGGALIVIPANSREKLAAHVRTFVYHGIAQAALVYEAQYRLGKRLVKAGEALG